MNRHQLASEIATSERLTLSSAVKAVDGAIRIIKETLAKGEDIYLRGLGTITVIKREAKMGRDFKSGKSIPLPAHRTVKLMVSNDLKKLLNSSSHNDALSL